MCAVSMVGDRYTTELHHWWPNGIPPTAVPQPYVPQPSIINTLIPGPSRAEFEALKKMVEQMKLDLEEAKRQDITEGNPDCEMEEKVELLKRVAQVVGVSLGDVFDKA